MLDQQSTKSDDSHLPERAESILLLAVSPTIWTLHFLVSYVAAATWCGMIVGRDGSLWGARWTIGIATVVALIGIALAARLGWKRHTRGGDRAPHDTDTPEDRHRFIGFATFLLSGLSAVATVYVALAAVVMETCH